LKSLSKIYYALKEPPKSRKEPSYADAKELTLGSLLDCAKKVSDRMTLSRVEVS
jgi:hypothetical protein